MIDLFHQSKEKEGIGGCFPQMGIFTHSASMSTFSVGISSNGRYFRGQFFLGHFFSGHFFVYSWFCEKTLTTAKKHESTSSAK